MPRNDIRTGHKNRNLLQAKGSAFVDTYEALKIQRFEVEFKIEGTLTHETRTNLTEQPFLPFEEVCGNIIAMKLVFTFG